MNAILKWPVGLNGTSESLDCCCKAVNEVSIEEYHLGKIVLDVFQRHCK